MALDPNDPIAVLLAIDRALRAGGIRAALYGGLALAAYGEPRETKDADLAVVGIVPSACMAALRAAGLDVHLAFEGVVFGGLRITRVTVFGSEPGTNTADLVEPRSEGYARRALERSVSGTLRGDTVEVLVPEDFVLFKVLSTRERDLEDAATVLDLLDARLDRALLETEAAALAAEIEDHDVRGRLSRVLSGR